MHIKRCDAPVARGGVVGSRRALLAGALATGLCGAWPLSTAQASSVVLSVITLSAAGATLRVTEFDMPALARLPQVTYTASTPWYDKPTQFTGPLLSDVLQAAGASGTTLVATALNDYKVEMPIADTLRHEPIVARLVNGQPMSVRDKGPLFVVFPFDRSPELRTERYFNRSVWQLNRLQVR